MIFLLQRIQTIARNIVLIHAYTVSHMAAFLKTLVKYSNKYFSQQKYLESEFGIIYELIITKVFCVHKLKTFHNDINTHTLCLH